MSTEPEINTESQDSSQYIRTFAKDFAALSGKNSETAAKKSHPKAEPRQSIKPIEAAPKVRGVQVLPRVGSKEMVQKTLAREAAAVIADLPTPSPIEVEREAILARLKAAREQHKPEVVPILQASPIEVPPAPTPTPPRIPEPPPIPKAPIPKPPPPKKTLSPKESPSPLHTYRSDFSDEVAERHATRFSVLAAEKDVKRKPRSMTIRRLNLLPVGIGFLLFIIGAGAVYVAYLYMKNSGPVPGVLSAPSLIVPDASVALSGTGLTLLQAFAQQANQSIPDGNVVITYINESSTTVRGVIQEPASGATFIANLNLPAPGILLRNIDALSTVGIVHAGAQTRPFFMLRVTSYERTYAGMLEWEANIAQDLALLYPRYPAPTTVVAPPIATTTSKSGAPLKLPPVLPTSVADQTAPAAQFVDEIVANRDTRALKDGAGRTLILYGYSADKQTLIIARDEASFNLLLTRLAVSKK